MAEVLLGSWRNIGISLTTDDMSRVGSGTAHCHPSILARLRRSRARCGELVEARRHSWRQIAITPIDRVLSVKAR